MKEITDKEYELFQKLKKIWFHSVPDKSRSYFICGVVDSEFRKKIQCRRI